MAAALSVRGLGKQYALGRPPPADTLRDAMVRAVGGLSASVRAERRLAARQQFWALRDISFEISTGQVVGIIGANGSGKSTLLKILSRITEPTAGTAVVAGRVGSLLEVGTGFHPELTGLENIYLNGAILGMLRADINRRLDEIIAFAEVERFLHMAVKHYSDGMYLRLAFAVAAHLEPDILLVDEVLAVGDARFQRKCLGKMSDIAEGQGRTVLVVSHNMSAVQRLCDRSLLLDRGQLVAYGRTDEVVARYLREEVRSSGPHSWIDVTAAPRSGSGVVRFHAVRYSSGNVRAGYQPYPDGPLEIVAELSAERPISVPSFGVVFSDRHGTKLVNADVLTIGADLKLPAGRTTVRLSIDELHLKAGVYALTLWAGDVVGAGYDLIEAAFEIDVVTMDEVGFGVTPGVEYGAVTCHLSVEIL